MGFYSGHKKSTESHGKSEVSHDSTNQSECPHNPPDVIASVQVEDLEKLNIGNKNEQKLPEPLDEVEPNGDSDDLERNEDSDDLEPNEDSEGSPSDESDDEDTWITPANYQTACEKMGGALETSLNGIAVGCVTTDYAMQVRRTNTFTVTHTHPAIHTHTRTERAVADGSTRNLSGWNESEAAPYLRYEMQGLLQVRGSTVYK